MTVTIPSVELVGSFPLSFIETLKQYKAEKIELEIIQRLTFRKGKTIGLKMVRRFVFRIPAYHKTRTQERIRGMA
jgi:hypothetical protein